MSWGLAERRILWIARQAVIERLSIASGSKAARADKKQARKHCKSQLQGWQMGGHPPLSSPFSRFHCPLLGFVLYSVGNQGVGFAVQRGKQAVDTFILQDGGELGAASRHLADGTVEVDV